MDVIIPLQEKREQEGRELLIRDVLDSSFPSDEYRNWCDAVIGTSAQHQKIGTTAQLHVWKVEVWHIIFVYLIIFFLR